MQILKISWALIILCLALFVGCVENKEKQNTSQKNIEKISCEAEKIATIRSAYKENGISFKDIDETFLPLRGTDPNFETHFKGTFGQTKFLLHIYEYTNPDRFNLAKSQLYKNLGDNQKIVEPRDMKYIKSPPLSINIRACQFLILSHACENLDELAWEEIKAVLSKFNRDYNIDIQCGGPLTWGIK